MRNLCNDSTSIVDVGQEAVKIVLLARLVELALEIEEDRLLAMRPKAIHIILNRVRVAVFGNDDVRVKPGHLSLFNVLTIHQRLEPRPIIHKTRPTDQPNHFTVESFPLLDLLPRKMGILAFDHKTV